VAWLLQEAPFNAEQKIEPIPGSDWQRVRAMVSNNQETLAWIFGMGEGIRVHQPASWRDTIKSKLQKMAALYSEPYSESTPIFQETL
jgi:predicted DNA-binding transcriptional regulator YafY